MTITTNTTAPRFSFDVDVLPSAARNALYLTLATGTELANACCSVATAISREPVTTPRLQALAALEGAASVACAISGHPLNFASKISIYRALGNAMVHVAHVYGSEIPGWAIVCKSIGSDVVTGDTTHAGEPDQCGDCGRYYLPNDGCECEDHAGEGAYLFRLDCYDDEAETNIRTHFRCGNMTSASHFETIHDVTRDAFGSPCDDWQCPRPVEAPNYDSAVAILREYMIEIGNSSDTVNHAEFWIVHPGDHGYTGACSFNALDGIARVYGEC
jgi:hypothetical protein